MKKLALGVLLSAASVFNYCAASDDWILKDACDPNTFCLHLVFQGFPESFAASDNVLIMNGGQKAYENQLQASTGLYNKPIVPAGSTREADKQDHFMHGKIKNGDMYVSLFNLGRTSCSSISGECGEYSYSPYYVDVSYLIKSINNVPVSGDHEINYARVSAFTLPQKTITITRQQDNTYNCQIK